MAADPDHAPARLALGTVLVALGRDAEAEPVLESAVEAFGLLRDQDSLVRGLVVLASLFDRTDRSLEAYRRLTMALRHDPDNLEIRAAMVKNRYAAGRWRDTLAAIEPIETRIASGLALRPDQTALVSELLLIAADCDIQLKQTERLAARYELAVSLHPQGRQARAALARLCHDSGRLAEAAKHTRALANLHKDPVERGRTLLQAGTLLHEAAEAMALADSDDPNLAEQTAAATALQAEAFESIAAGLALIADQKAPVLDCKQLTATFWTAAPRNPQIALTCLERLQLHPDLSPQDRAAIVIEGSRLAQQRAQPGDPERALALARSALELVPNIAAAAHAVVDLLEAQASELSAIETVVLGFFNHVGRSKPADPRESADRQRLLTRLADRQYERPERAVRLLERAAELDPHGLNLAARRRLAELYRETAADSPSVLTNDEALLRLDPLDTRCLADLARRCLAQGHVDHAHAVYQLLRIADPSHTEATAFLGKSEFKQVSNGKLDVNAIIELPPSGGGVVAAISQLWEGGAPLICDELPRPDISEAAWIEADSDRDTLLWKVWTELGQQLGTHGVRLADAALIRNMVVEDGWTRVVAAHPAVIIAGEAARHADTAPRLRFVLGAALFACRPAAAVICGLSPAHSAAVLSATLQAFHPRHTRRVRAREDADLATRLAQLFARKLPIRLARQISASFKDHEQEPFDSRDWRAWAERSSQRVGLALARNLSVALDILGLPSDPNERAAALRTRSAEEPNLRDLLSFATSPAFATARRTLGFAIHVRG